MLRKVTDPKKIVTDSLVLKELKRQKIDKDYVEFHEDYNAQHPYSKVYHDLKSHKYLMVITGAPKVCPDNKKIEPEWEVIGNEFHSKKNLFHAEIRGSKIRVSAIYNFLNNGIKVNDYIEWNPQLFINGVEQFNDGAELLDYDPDCDNFVISNTIQWNYGVCVRRVRLTEGNIYEKWIFSEKPSGEIKIKHNNSGSLKLELGVGKGSDGLLFPLEVKNDEEILGLEYDKYPLEIGASPETFIATADGVTYGWEAGQDTFANIWGHVGNILYSSQTTMSFCAFISGGVTDRYTQFQRGHFHFDTAAIMPDGAIITEATLSIYGTAKANTWATAQNLYICSLTPDTPGTITQSDHEAMQYEQTSHGSVVYASYNTAGYNVITLDASGITYLQNTCLTGYAVLGFKTTPDINGAFNLWAASKTTDFSCAGFSNADSAKRPKLIITYIPPPVEVSGTANGVLSASLALSLGKVEEVSGTASGVLSASLALSVIKNVSGITANPTSLVTNGNMELDSDWINYGSGGDIPTNERSNDHIHSGDWSRKLVVTATNVGVQTQDLFTITVGRTYIATAWIYISTISGGNEELVMYLKAPGTYLICGVTDTVGSWVQIEKLFVAIGDTGISFRNNSDSATFYVDDVSIREIYGALDTSLILGLERPVSGQADGKLYARIHLSISGEEITDGIMRGY